MQVIGVLLVTYAIALVIYLLAGTGPASIVVEKKTILLPSLSPLSDSDIAFIPAMKLKPK